MPFRHVAMFRWADDVGDDHVVRVRDAFDRLTAQVPGIRSLTHGTDVGVTEGAYDYLVVADFDSVAEWRAFRDHPAHVLLVEELLRDDVAERVVGQFTVAAERLGPSLGAASPATATWTGAPVGPGAGPAGSPAGSPADEIERGRPSGGGHAGAGHSGDVGELSDDELLERARRAAQACMDALLAEPDDDIAL